MSLRISPSSPKIGMPALADDAATEKKGLNAFISPQNISGSSIFKQLSSATKAKAPFKVAAVSSASLADGPHFQVSSLGLGALFPNESFEDADTSSDEIDTDDEGSSPSSTSSGEPEYDHVYYDSNDDDSVTEDEVFSSSNDN